MLFSVVVVYAAPILGRRHSLVYAACSPRVTNVAASPLHFPATPQASLFARIRLAGLPGERYSG
ncbi:hypothetical protein BH23ACT6_BH23ACT6_14710 [soil metagenome]